MTLLLYHPEIIDRSCEDCRRWMFEGDGTERMGSKRAMRGGQPIPRPANAKLPCFHCPKKSPELAPVMELTERNQQAVRLYYEVQATFGVGQPLDAVATKNCGIIGQIVRRHETAISDVSALLPALLALKGNP